MNSSPQTPLPWRDRLLAGWLHRGWRGAHRLARFLGFSGRESTLLARSRHGVLFELFAFSYIDRIVLRSGYYESEVLDALRPHLGPGAVLWDIGANFGLHAVTARLLFPAATVIAFEPAPAVHARLLKNAALNVAPVRTVALALSDRTGYAPLHLAPPGNSGMTTLSPWSGGSYTGTVLVAIARGDDLIAAGTLPAPTVIKIDVEGHELAALQGLAATLRSGACHAVIFEDALTAGSEVKTLLRSFGFTVAPLDRHENSAHTLGNFAAIRP